jgi:hypothetical protein
MLSALLTPEAVVGAFSSTTNPYFKKRFDREGGKTSG